MPKMKTHRGAAARFKVTGTGKVLRRHSKMNHLLEKKNSVKTRRLKHTEEVAHSDRKKLRRLLGV